MAYGYIYKTTNLINGKIYIGQHICDHFDEKYKGSGIFLLKAFKKYKRKNFSCELIEWCENKEILDEKEDFYINFYNSRDLKIGYNLKKGGSHGKHSLESIKLMKKNKPYIEPWNKGRKNVYTEETINNISDSLKSFYRADKNNHPWTGKHHTEETKEKIRQSEKGKYIPLEVRIKMGEASKRNALNNPNYGMRGKHHTEENKKKIGKASKGKKFITNGIHNKYVKPEIAENYFSLNEGWKYGKTITTKGRIRITNGIDNKFVSLEDFNNIYLKLGWFQGITRKDR